MATETKESYVLKETFRQPYDDCYIAAGFVEGHPIDTTYIRLERGEEDILILLRLDELAAINYLTGMVLWQELLGQKIEEEE